MFSHDLEASLGARACIQAACVPYPLSSSVGAYQLNDMAAAYNDETPLVKPPESFFTMLGKSNHIPSCPSEELLFDERNGDHRGKILVALVIYIYIYMLWSYYLGHVWGFFNSY